MASPSPLDRCWKVKDSPGSLPIMPAVRAAVERHWPDTQRAAASVLGDESLARRSWRGQSNKLLPTLPTILPRSGRCERNPVSLLQARGWASAQGTQVIRLHRSFFCSPNRPGLIQQISAAEAVIDAERILADAPPEVREAMMMRYGGSESWADVAARTATSVRQLRVLERRAAKRYQPERYERNAKGVSTASDNNWEFRVHRSKLRQRYFTRPGRIQWTSVSRFSRMMTMIRCSLRSFRSMSSKNTLTLSALAVSTMPP